LTREENPRLTFVDIFKAVALTGILSPCVKNITFISLIQKVTTMSSSGITPFHPSPFLIAQDQQPYPGSLSWAKRRETAPPFATPAMALRPLRKSPETDSALVPLRRPVFDFVDGLGTRPQSEGMIKQHLWPDEIRQPHQPETLAYLSKQEINGILEVAGQDDSPNTGVDTEAMAALQGWDRAMLNAKPPKLSPATRSALLEMNGGPAAEPDANVTPRKLASGRINFALSMLHYRADTVFAGLQTAEKYGGRHYEKHEYAQVEAQGYAMLIAAIGKNLLGRFTEAIRASQAAHARVEQESTLVMPRVNDRTHTIFEATRIAENEIYRVVGEMVKGHEDGRPLKDLELMAHLNEAEREELITLLQKDHGGDGLAMLNDLTRAGILIRAAGVRSISVPLEPPSHDSWLDWMKQMPAPAQPQQMANLFHWWGPKWDLADREPPRRAVAQPSDTQAVQGHRLVEQAFGQLLQKAIEQRSEHRDEFRAVRAVATRLAQAPTGTFAQQTGMAQLLRRDASDPQAVTALISPMLEHAFRQTAQQTSTTPAAAGSRAAAELV
jgi:hypothetical protein